MKTVLRLVISLVFLFVSVASVKAYCDPEDCHGSIGCGDPDFSCVVGCCVGPSGGGTNWTCFPRGRK